MYHEGKDLDLHTYTMLTKPITIKHGGFGGALETDYLYAAGSDDFRGYVWKIPPLSVLEEQRKVFSADEWENRRSPITEIGELFNCPETLVIILMESCLSSQRLLEASKR